MGDGLNQVLAFFARHGRLVLVAGLLTGILLPTVATIVKPNLPLLVAMTLFLAALRIGPREALGKLKDLQDVVGLIGIYQIVVPLVLFFVLHYLQ